MAANLEQLQDDDDFDLMQPPFDVTPILQRVGKFDPRYHTRIFRQMSQNLRINVCVYQLLWEGAMHLVRIRKSSFLLNNRQIYVSDVFWPLGDCELLMYSGNRNVTYRLNQKEKKLNAITNGRYFYKQVMRLDKIKKVYAGGEEKGIRLHYANSWRRFSVYIPVSVLWNHVHILPRGFETKKAYCKKVLKRKLRPVFEHSED